MRLFTVTAPGHMAIVAATSAAAALRQKEAEQDRWDVASGFSVIGARPATEADIAWVKAMGGHIPSVATTG